MATLVVVGIMSVFVLGKTDFASFFRQRSTYDTLIANLQLARKAAVAQRRQVCVAVAANQVTFTVHPYYPEDPVVAHTFAGVCANALDLPGRSTGCPANAVCAQSGTVIGSSMPSFSFDPQGRPSAAVSMTITGQPGITVEGETGYVH